MLKSLKYITFIFFALNVFLYYYLNRGWDNSVGIVMSYGLGGQGSIPDKGKIIPMSIVSRLTLGPIKPPIQWVPAALSPWLKRPGGEAEHSPPSPAEVKNDGGKSPFPNTSSQHVVYVLKNAYFL